MTDARTAELNEPNAMTLSTATADGRPSGRIVLLKELTAEDFIFYTNYTSRKGKEIEDNPFVSLTFYWAELERQVRVEGLVRRVSREKSEAYFRGRPKGSRLGRFGFAPERRRFRRRAPLEDKPGRLGSRRYHRLGRCTHARVVGRLCASGPKPSNSGRVGQTGFTIGSSIRERGKRGGRSGGYLLSSLGPRPDKALRL